MVQIFQIGLADGQSNSIVLDWLTKKLPLGAFLFDII
jgi:hypothetical protein